MRRLSRSADEHAEAQWVTGRSPTRCEGVPPARRCDRGRPDRVCHRAAAARARAGGDPAPGTRLARAVRALRGPRRARLPHTAGQPARTRRRSAARSARAEGSASASMTRQLVAGTRAPRRRSDPRAQRRRRSRADPLAPGARAASRGSAHGLEHVREELAAGRSLGARRDRGGDAAGRARTPLPALADATAASAAGTPRRRPGARGPAVAVPRRAGLRAAATRGRRR